MTPDEFERIDRLFTEACSLPASQRAEYLRQQCDGHEDVRRRVEAMLAEDGRAPQPLDGRPSLQDLDADKVLRDGLRLIHRSVREDG